MIRSSLSHRHWHSLRSIGRFVIVVAGVALQGGCAAATDAIASPGKTPLDRVYSWASGKDCSLVRARHGDTYCVEDEMSAPAVVHCYPTLGEVTCYATSDPFHGRQREIGHAPRSMQPRPDVLDQSAELPSAG